jgi:hypothetical protein
MSITGVVASQAYQQDFRQLTSALSSNDLAGAQRAFQSLGSAPAPKHLTAPPEIDPIRAELTNLSAALQAGDLKGAQVAFDRLLSATVPSPFSALG